MFSALRPDWLLRPGSYVAFLPCRMQFKQKIMKQIISLSIVSIAFDTAEMRRMNRALGYLHLFVKKLSQIGKHWFWFGGKKSVLSKLHNSNPKENITPWTATGKVL